MDGSQRAAGLGVTAAAALVVLLVVPYALVDARALGVYYGDLVGPPLAGLFAAIAAIALLGAARGRTDPPTAAGVAVVLAVLAVGLLGRWALGVSPALVGSLTELAAFEWHRWALAAAGVVQLAAGSWYARTAVRGR